SLLLGRLELALELSKDRARINAIAGRTLSGDLYLREGRAHLPLADVENLISREPMGLTGTVEVDLERLEFAPGRITAAQGSLNIENAGLAPPLKVAIGSFRMDFASTEEGTIKGVLSDSGGPLQAQGLLLLQPDGNYRLTAELAARDPQRRDIKQALRYLGTPSPAGKVSLVRTGRLPLEKVLGVGGKD
ncbi:MAG: type II secretion system protein N, partial [Gammaproteobacteria bacterium]